MIDITGGGVREKHWRTTRKNVPSFPAEAAEVRARSAERNPRRLWSFQPARPICRHLLSPPMKSPHPSSLSPGPSVSTHTLWHAMLAFAVLWALAASAAAQGPTCGPPKIAAGGALWSFSSSFTPDDGSASTDFYYQPGGGFAIQSDAQVFSLDGNGNQSVLIGSYSGSRFYDTGGSPMANMAPVDSDGNFADPDAGVTVIVSGDYGVPHLLQWNNSDSLDRITSWNADLYFQRNDGAWVAKFLAFPVCTFQVGDSYGGNASPPYNYSGYGTPFSNVGGDGWPSPGFGAPPDTMYVNGQALVQSGFSKGGSAGNYSESFGYQSPQNASLVASFTRSLSLGDDGNPVSSGTVTGSGMTGDLNPYTMGVMSISSSGPPGSISFSLPAGTPTHGPAVVIWGVNSVSFRYAAWIGSDVYWDSGSGKMVVIGAVIGSSGSYPVSAYGDGSMWSGSYDPSTGKFSEGSPLAALDAWGNLTGTPPGVVAFFGADPGTVSLNSADGSTPSPAYSWRTSGGAWAVKFVSVPARPFWVYSDGGSSGVYSYRGEAGGDLIVSTSGGGWIYSNIHPQTIYVNAVAFGKGEDYPDTDTNPSSGHGGAAYSAGGGKTFSLTWSLNGSISAWSGTWSYSEDGGSTEAASGNWDGGNGFGGQWPVISLSPPSTAARFGPQRVAWDGSIFNYNPLASFMAGGNDVYQNDSGTIRIQIDPSGNASVSNSTTGVSGYGSYTAATHRFDFGPSFTGVVQALSAGEQLFGDTNMNGSLDVLGSTFNFATSLGNLNKPAFAWLHRSAPIVPGGPSGNHLRWLTATSLYEWTWEAPATSAGYYTPLMALRSHPFPTLAVSVPITSPGGQVVIGPYHDVSFLENVGPSGNRATGVFVVAAGKKVGNTPAPLNALRVTDDGTVLIQRGGDISMGEFTAGPQP